MGRTLEGSQRRHEAAHQVGARGDHHPEREGRGVHPMVRKQPCIDRQGPSPFRCRRERARLDQVVIEVGSTEFLLRRPFGSAPAPRAEELRDGSGERQSLLAFGGIAEPTVAEGAQSGPERVERGRARRKPFEYRTHPLGQGASGPQAFLDFGRGIDDRGLAPDEQVGDRAVRKSEGEFGRIIPPVPEPSLAALGMTDAGRAENRALQATLPNRTFPHGSGTLRMDKRSDSPPRPRLAEPEQPPRPVTRIPGFAGLSPRPWRASRPRRGGLDPDAPEAHPPAIGLERAHEPVDPTTEWVGIWAKGLASIPGRRSCPDSDISEPQHSLDPRQVPLCRPLPRSQVRGSEVPAGVSARRWGPARQTLGTPLRSSPVARRGGPGGLG